jgi:predicted DNA-binding transcriptional regulator AlpA
MKIKNIPALNEELPSGIPDALRNFDQLPDSAQVRLPVLKGLYACSDATIWRRVKDGSIPAPEKFSPRIASWNVGKLRRARSLSGNGVDNVPA